MEAVGDALADRVAGAIIAFACGDAAGLPWEGRAPTEIDARIADLPARRGRPAGSTSDDTALTLLVAEHLVSSGGPGASGAGGAGGALDFARRLSDQADRIPGLGPSTRAAIGRFRRTGELPDRGGDADGGGNTNGAPMRALPVGWATPAHAAELRRRWTIELTRATHAGREAQAAACVAAACASWSLQPPDAGADPQRRLVEVAVAEAEESVRRLGADGALPRLLRDVAVGAWSPPDAGISLDPYETVTAVLHCVVHAADSPPDTGLHDGLLRAVRLGGDTDTVAALVAGLLGARHTADEIHALLPWSRRVLLPAPDTVARLASGLVLLRDRRPTDAP
jgi:ADP-ribosylglycohydrolase